MTGTRIENKVLKVRKKIGAKANKVRRYARSRVEGVVNAFYKGHRYRCNCCGVGLRMFRRRGPAGNIDNTCPFCLAAERQRFALRAFQTLSANGRLSFKGIALHVAPELPLGGFLQSSAEHYLALDLAPANRYYMPLSCRADLTNLPLRDGSIDYVVCSHVLEHIPDDRRAMSELARVLRPGGWAFLPVPLRGEETDEDPTVTDPRERARRFGQWDHVRYYGRADYLRRLRAAGLEPDLVAHDGVMSEPEARGLGITDRFADTRHLWLFRRRG